MSIEGVSDIFPMHDAGQWVYRVRLYLSGHSQLQIQLGNQKTKQVLFINFTGVEFYDGPLEWSGKGFSRGDSTECLRILKSMESFSNENENDLINDYSLYIVKPENGYRIRIVASGKPTLTQENFFSAYIP